MGHEHTDPPHAVGLLSVRGDRQSGCRAPEKHDEIAPPHLPLRGQVKPPQGVKTSTSAVDQTLAWPRGSCPWWVIFDGGGGLCRAAHFRFAPKADVRS
jgi:hypothetical protein